MNTPEPNELDQKEIVRLAALTKLAYDREREMASMRLGCRTAVLDELVESEREGFGDSQNNFTRKMEPDTNDNTN